MNPRGYALFAMGLIGCLAGIVILNLYVVKPMLIASPAAAPALVAPVPAPLAGVDEDMLIIKDSEQAIREIDSQLALDQEEGQVREHANPFLWSEELAAVSNKKQIEKAARQEELQQEKQQARQEEIEVRQQVEIQRPKLTMVIIGEKRKLALLDDIFVYEGEQFRENMVVKEIRENEVVLLTDIEEIRIPLADVRVVAPIEPEEVVAEAEEPEASAVSGQQTGTDGKQQSIQKQVEMINTLVEQLKPFLQEGK